MRLEPARADVIVGGTAVLLVFLHELCVQRFLVSEEDIWYKIANQFILMVVFSFIYGIVMGSYNGAMQAIAGVCDPSGRLFGLMPHPDAYLYPCHHPQWSRRRYGGELPEEGAGLAIFRNGVDAAAAGQRAD